MPNKNTFQVKPIHNLINKYLKGNWIDPFAGRYSPAGTKNDIDPDIPVLNHLDALVFLKLQPDKSFYGTLFDPPYSPRQVSESYRKHGLSVNMQTTQSSYWSKLKNEISRIIRPDGICITFSWNSTGIGKKLGFEIIEILIICHGGWHNDTIITVDRKSKLS